MEIVPQVHLVPGTRGANVFLIVEETGLSLIDTGFPRSAGAILRYISQLGHRPKDLTRIVLTHYHLDHAGGAAELRTRTGAEIMIHEADLPERRKRGTSLPTRLYARTLGAITEAIREPKGMQDAILLRDGQLLPLLGGLEVIHTPGHSPGGICLYSRSRSMIFMGDLMINNVKRLSRPISSHDWVSEDYRKSLQFMATLDFEIGLFSHGPPILREASRLVNQLAERSSTSLPPRIAPNLGKLMHFSYGLIRRNFPRRRT